MSKNHWVKGIIIYKDGRKVVGMKSKDGHIIEEDQLKPVKLSDVKEFQSKGK